LTLKVFITGASSGIGEALAVYYAAQGATLGLVARRAGFLDGLNQRLGGQHACYALDVSDAPALHAAATDFLSCFGAPDIIIANAGVSAGTLTEFEEDLEVFRRVMDTNVFGMAATFAPFIPAMKAAGGANGKMQRLVGIASVAGIRGLPGAEAYSASKAAAISYLESLRLEMRPYGIKVVTIAPGYIETPMTAVNPYKMPFLLPVAAAAKRFALAIERGTSYAVIPWQMGVVAKILRALPNWLYDRLFTGAPRKPRGLLK
jgi:NAD(P)-dependent dehydrogenase (short-subunit alcohol dehydrogenase family)